MAVIKIQEGKWFQLRAGGDSKLLHKMNDYDWQNTSRNFVSSREKYMYNVICVYVIYILYTIKR